MGELLLEENEKQEQIRKLWNCLQAKKIRSRLKELKQEQETLRDRIRFLEKRLITADRTEFELKMELKKMELDGTPIGKIKEEK